MMSDKNEQGFGENFKPTEEPFQTPPTEGQGTAGSGWTTPGASGYGQYNPTPGQNPNMGANPNKSNPYSYGTQGNPYSYGHQTPPTYNTTPPPPQENYQWNFQDYETAAKNNAPKPKKSKGLVVFASLIAIILVVGVVSFSGFAIYNYIAEGNPSVQPPISSQPDIPGISLKDKPDVPDETLPEGRLTSAQISKKVKPSVVGIVTYQGNNSYAPSAEGSGVIMTSDGYILTNAHVVEGAMGVKVVLDNGEEYTGEVKGFDTRTDLAVIKIQAENLAFAEFGNSDQVEVGEKAIAIGNPNGMAFSGSVTQGIISAVDRPVRGENGYTMDFIQTDAAINPGNSGGALVNEFGQVVGINSAKFVSEGYEGIGFAIPINTAIPIAEELIKNGKVTGRVMLGITGEEIDSIVAQYYNIPRGLHIISIDPRSDLVNKKVVPGDIITAVNDIAVSSADDVAQVLNDFKPGDSVKLTIYRRSNANLSAKNFDVNVQLITDAEKDTFQDTSSQGAEN